MCGMLVRNYFPQCSQILRIQWKHCSTKPINPNDLAERFSMSGHGKVQDRLNREVMTAILGTTSQGGDRFISHNFDQASGTLTQYRQCTVTFPEI